MKNIYRISSKAGDQYTDPRPMKQVLGGKGAGLMLMTEAGMNVPPAFTLTTDICNSVIDYDDLMSEVVDHMEWMAGQFGYMPLVSVRSGAPVSMPGMMDTILNVGLNDLDLPEWSKRIGERAALDSYRRLIQMLGSTAYGVPMAHFDADLENLKAELAIDDDADLDVGDLTELIVTYKKTFQVTVGKEFPQEPVDQLRAAIKAVFGSWHNERAVTYRQMNKIDPAMGTACTVQAMVFGNMGDDSGSGVAFTRNPSTGEKKIMAEYLENAQGEDVVAGIRTPQNLQLDDEMMAPDWCFDLLETCKRLEAMYGDMVDLEFTVQNEQLFILQSRVGKRSAAAAFKIAVDLVEEGVIDRDEAIKRITPAQYKLVRRPIIDPTFKGEPVAVGIPGCPGVVTGRPVYSSQAAVDATDKVILVTHETNPDDIAGMNAAVGILTAMGGATSHAAVVARAMDKPCVVGCTQLKVNSNSCEFPGVSVTSNAKMTIDGATGRIWIGVDVPVIDNSQDPAVQQVLQWCQERSGTVEPSASDDGSDAPQRIVAAMWWGDAEVAEAVMKSLAALPPAQQKNVVLDVTAPNKFAPSDTDLLNCFGNGAEITFSELFKLLNAYGPTMKDVTLVGADAELFGMKGVREPQTVADLMTGEPVEISPAFVQGVCGGDAAFAELAAMLEQAGKPVHNVLKAQALEYTAFTELGR